MNNPKTKQKGSLPKDVAAEPEQKEQASDGDEIQAMESEPREEQSEHVIEETAPAEESAPASLEEQLEAAKTEGDNYLDQWKRAQAELENYKRRIHKEIEKNRLYQSLPLARDLLPALDNLQRAIKAAENSENIEELIEGVQMVAKQLEDILGRHSAVRIEAVGKPFDPNQHEALQHVPSDEHPPMTVLEEIEPGYVIHDRVVRPSKVIVSSGPAEEKSEHEAKAETEAQSDLEE